jgi:hypothetical protein
MIVNCQGVIWGVPAESSQVNVIVVGQNLAKPIGWLWLLDGCWAMKWVCLPTSSCTMRIGQGQVRGSQENNPCLRG